MFFPFVARVAGGLRGAKTEGTLADEATIAAMLMQAPPDRKGTSSTDSSESGSDSTQLVTAHEREADYWRGKALALAEEVSALKLETTEQAASLARMNEAYDKAMTAHEERVLTLEMEIERLIGVHIRGTSDPARTPLKCEAKGETPEDAAIQIYALEELLARVLAEKDLMAFRLQNLQALVKEMAERKTAQDMADRYYRHDKTKDGIVYQLSCGEHSIIGMTQQHLVTKVKDHFREVWTMVRIGSRKKHRGDMVGPFGQSQFAKHIAEQCRKATSEEDAMQWCQENVKVEVLRIRNLD